MTEWLILVAANLLKAGILAGLSLVSWGVHTFASCDPSCRLVESVDGAVPAPWVVVEIALVPAAAQDPTAWGAVRATATPKALPLPGRPLLPRLGSLVPPIRVEAIYPPDVLVPPVSWLSPDVPAPPAPPDPRLPQEAVRRSI